MHALVWLVSGLIAGWLASISMKERRSGFVVNFTLGILGGVIGAWVLRSLGGSAPPAGSPAFFLVSVLGAMMLVGVARVAARLNRQVKKSTGVSVPVVQDLEAYMRRLGKVERRVFNAVLRRQTVARDTTQTFNDQLTIGQRTADRVAEFGGSWTFLGLFFSFMLGWILVNSGDETPYDPYPFILLNLMLSCLAAVQAPIIMMSQNRQAYKDRRMATHDYEVNLKAEIEILALHEKLDALRTHQLQELVMKQQQQLDLLQQLATRLEAQSAKQ